MLFWLLSSKVINQLKMHLDIGFSAFNCLLDFQCSLFTSQILGSCIKLNWSNRAYAVYWLCGTLLYPWYWLMSDCLEVEISDNHQRWRPSPCFQRTLSFVPSFLLHSLLACLSAAASLPILKIHSSWCPVIEGIASWGETRTNATLISSIYIHFYSITAFWLGLVIFHLSSPTSYQQFVPVSWGQMWYHEI